MGRRAYDSPQEGVVPSGDVREVVDALSQVVWTADARGRVAYRNRRWFLLAGEGATDVAVVVHPDDRAAFCEGCGRAVEQGQAWEAEVRIGARDVGWRAHRVQFVPRCDDAGQIVSWVGSCTDVEDRARAERALQLLVEAGRRLNPLERPVDVESVLRSALPLLGDALLLDASESPPASGTAMQVKLARHDADAALLSNSRIERGRFAVAHTGRALLHLDVALEMRATTSAFELDGLRALHELGVTAYVCLPLAGASRMFGTLTVLRLGAVITKGELALAEDLARRIGVTFESAHLETALERGRARLEQADRSKDVFLATLSHELRTPLNAIVGWTEMMKTGELVEGELPRGLDAIDRNANALAQLVADLLDASGIVTGTLEIDAKPVAIAPVVMAAVDASRPSCDAKGIALEAELCEVGWASGDAGRLRQIVGNLLSNAIKFTPAGGRIGVRLRRDGAHARLTVEDTGEGIDAELLPHVFDHFRQAEGTRAGGLGLGLAIAKHLVSEHGGTLTAESAGRGAGATFTVDLPILVEHAGASPPPLAAEMPDLRGLHALIIEDDPDGNDLITTILERYGARVTSVATAAAALDALDDERPDVVVSDIGLPDASGIDLIKCVRTRPGGASLPAIALTAYASKQDAANALAAGFDAHVAKPVQPSMLGSVLARLVLRREGVVNPRPAA